jgi:hypothetical protein
MMTNPETGRKELVNNAPTGVKAAWYAVPIVMTFIGAMAWLVG